MIIILASGILTGALLALIGMSNDMARHPVLAATPTEASRLLELLGVGWLLGIVLGCGILLLARAVHTVFYQDEKNQEPKNEKD